MIYDHMKTTLFLARDIIPNTTFFLDTSHVRVMSIHYRRTPPEYQASLPHAFGLRHAEWAIQRVLVGNSHMSSALVNEDTCFFVVTVPRHVAHFAPLSNQVPHVQKVPSVLNALVEQDFFSLRSTPSAGETSGSDVIDVNIGFPVTLRPKAAIFAGFISRSMLFCNFGMVCSKSKEEDANRNNNG